MDLKLNLADIKFPEFARLAEPLRQVSEFAGQAARNIQDALGDSVLQLVKGNAQSIGQIWQDLLQRMVAQALAAKLGEALFGNYGKTGEFGGLLAGLGSLTYGGARANGGPVMAGRAYLVGERGPEVIVPQSSGMVVPNGAVGGVAVSITNNVAAGVTRGELVSALQLTEQQTRANLMRELRAMRVI
jgi:phage-related minor tail protein